MSRHLLPVAAELNRWRDQGLELPLWWRDDDATTPTTALVRLLALASGFSAPLHIAVIPEPAMPELADGLRGASTVFVLPHGWRHENHASAADKKAEYGAHRAVPLMIEEIEAGWRRLQTLFGVQALPIFTPPWNRACSQVVEGLPGIGMRAISTFTPRRARYAAKNLLQVNTHIDPIDWHGGSGLLEPRRLVSEIVVQLGNRRRMISDNAEPFGLLTHHLVHNDAVWSFTADLLDVLTQSGVAKWTSPLQETRRSHKL